MSKAVHGTRSLLAIISRTPDDPTRKLRGNSRGGARGSVRDRREALQNRNRCRLEVGKLRRTVCGGRSTSQPCGSSVPTIPMKRRQFLERSWLGSLTVASGCSLLPSGGRGPERLFFTASGKTCVIDSTGQNFHELEVSAPGQVTWQPAGFLEDGRVLLLSMEARRDGPGRPAEGREAIRDRRHLRLIPTPAAPSGDRSIRRTRASR